MKKTIQNRTESQKDKDSPKEGFWKSREAKLTFEETFVILEEGRDQLCCFPPHIRSLCILDQQAWQKI